MLGRRRLGLGDLDAEAQRRKQLLEGPHRRLAELLKLEAVEVVDVVPRRQEQQAAQQQGIPAAIEIPDGRRSAEIHHEVIPEGQARRCGEERAPGCVQATACTRSGGPGRRSGPCRRQPCAGPGPQSSPRSGGGHVVGGHSVASPPPIES